MAFAAHNGPLFFCEVASFAVRMECFSQARCITGAFLIMAIRATLVFGRLIFQFLSIFINMVAFAAIFELGCFVVFIMSKNNRGTLLF
jgi:hypothetical protein